MGENGKLVRICPLCGKHNPPDESFCACGTLLADVDFTHVGAAAAPQAAPEPAPEPVPEHGKQSTVICPHADCGQTNPLGSARCLYCNRPLAVVPVDDRQSRLPPSLRTRYRVLEALPTEGGQADLLLVENAQHARRIAKLYRTGIKPDRQVLDRLRGIVVGHLVRIDEHGEADGVAFEVMEYCPEGSLRLLLEQGPQPTEVLRPLIEQLSETLAALHAQHILHRDLKPENVLLRTGSPLDIALTDFGAATLKMATQYFTGGARTAHYAAPEVLTGVLDEKSDWWSFGMMLLEAATGRHPFASLSEQVALHQLATQSVEVKDVYDDGLRMLCRGLLLRNPKKRWGGAEVARWLAGDPSLAMPVDDGDGVAVKPYVLGRSQCQSRADLALALVRHWDDGRKDLMRGTIENWVEQDLRDFNLARDIHDVLKRRDLSDDARLLRVILAALPGIPPIWKGKLVTQQTLVHSAKQAVADNQEALSWLLSLYREDVLKTFGESGNADMTALAAAWGQGVESYREQWERARQLEEAWRKRPRAHDNEVADVDYMMYLAPVRMSPPSQNRILVDVILALYLPAYGEAARNAVRHARAAEAEPCGWFVELADSNDAMSGAVRWAALQRLLPFALEDAAKEKERRQQTVRNSDKGVLSSIWRIEKSCVRLLDYEHMPLHDLAQFEQLQRDAGDWIETAVWAKGLDHDNGELARIVERIDPVLQQAMKLQSALNDHLENMEVNAIWLARNRLLLGAAIVLFSSGFSRWFAALLLAVAVVFLVRRTRLAKASGEEVGMRLRRLVEAARQLHEILPKSPLKYRSGQSRVEDLLKQSECGDGGDE